MIVADHKPIIVSFWNYKWELLKIVDIYYSLIWTERFDGLGEFELYLDPDPWFVGHMGSRRVDTADSAVYVTIPNSECFMLLERISFSTDIEEGTKMLLGGRSGEAILAKRVISVDRQIPYSHETYESGNREWDYQTVEGTCRNLFKLEYNTSSRSPQCRTIEWGWYMDDPWETVNPPEHEADYTPFYSDDNYQFKGETVYEAMMTVCKQHDMSIRARKVLTTRREGGQTITGYRVEFEPYTGVNRSYHQAGFNENGIVSFRESTNSLLSFKYAQDHAEYCNALFIRGESERYKVDFEIQAGNGYNDWFDRQECYEDVTSISDSLEDGTQLSYMDYYKRIQETGRRNLGKDHNGNPEIEAEVDTFHYVPNQDYYVGDIVTVGSDVFVSRIARVNAIIIKLDEAGYNIYPEFEIMGYSYQPN